ncbi:MAG TPA: hypothetical protein VK475_06265 [Pyrinomonadaceae bacterium]|nr:hypothetical protein [Pyrinomonadaceae bacterium]
MKPWSLLALLILVLAVFVGGHPISSAREVVVPPMDPVQAATRFASVYSPLTKCGSGMTKKEEREAEKHGSDIPSRCRGFGGYVVDISYSACASSLALVKGDERVSLGMQALNWPQKTIEWRLANGKPFAVIMRVYEYAGNDLCTTDGKVTKESLVVTGLKGFEIEETVDARTPNANLKARELADKAYAKIKS